MRRLISLGVVAVVAFGLVGQAEAKSKKCCQVQTTCCQQQAAPCASAPACAPAPACKTACAPAPTCQPACAPAPACKATCAPAPACNAQPCCSQKKSWSMPKLDLFGWCKPKQQECCQSTASAHAAPAHAAPSQVKELAPPTPSYEDKAPAPKK